MPESEGMVKILVNLGTTRYLILSFLLPLEFNLSNSDNISVNGDNKSFIFSS